MHKEIDFFDEIGNFVFTSKYARYDEKHQRRETWHEAVKRVEKMHFKKYASLPSKDLEEIAWAFDQVREKHIVPSMRSMQFGGKPIETQNVRLFNCAVGDIDSIRSFSEIFFLLMCGTGVGFGLNKKFLNRLPDLVDKTDRTGTVVTYVVEDSIEGWADSIEALLRCYFKNNAYTGRKITFDFSKIRPKGAPIKTGGGKAPGHEGLKQSLHKIKDILDYIIEEKGQTRLTSINAYDITMHMADAVLSGGVRRCLPSYYSVQMSDGKWKKISDIVPGEAVLFNGKSYPVTQTFNNGAQDLIKINTADGFHVSTPNHRWLVYNNETKKIEWVEAQFLSPKYTFLTTKKDKYLPEETGGTPPVNTTDDKSDNTK